jgi:hypothetical protein
MVWFTMDHVGELLTLRIFNSRKRTRIGENGRGIGGVNP